MGVLIHDTTHYQVFLIEQSQRIDFFDIDGNRIEGNYEIHNKQHGTIEHGSNNLPVALSICEQFNAIIEGKEYLNQSEDMFVNTGSLN